MLEFGLSIFSPNLKYLLTVVFDDDGKQFVINKIVENDFVPFCNIPNDILDAEQNLEDPNIKNKLKFLTDDLIRIVDNKSI